MAKKNLAVYRSKRDFRKSPEPADTDTRRPKFKSDKNAIFVIQMHDARRLHYDFRLEYDGVLASWAVPKGPSLDPKERRLAVQTEDHPLSYADFEGIIPQGEYGAGPVIVWDAGPYQNITRDKRGKIVPMRDAIKNGKVEVWVEGKKIRGGFVFVRTKMDGKKSNWFLIKMKDEGATAEVDPVALVPESVLSGKRIDELEAEGG